MIIVPNLTQGSREWIDTRLGVLTASRVSQILTKTLKLSAQRKGLLAELIAEKITGEPADDFGGTFYTERGSDFEGEASAYFELQTNLVLRAVGFVFRGDNARDCGCSPDALVYEPCQADGEAAVPVAGLELKVPKARTHVGYLLGESADQYTPQVQFSLWVTQLPVWYFMSYHPGLPPFLIKVEPAKSWQDAFDEHVPEFLGELRLGLAKVRGLQ